MEALTALVVSVAGLVALQLWVQHRERLWVKRQEARLELVKTKGDAYRADKLLEVEERVRKLELRGLAR